MVEAGAAAGAGGEGGKGEKAWGKGEGGQERGWRGGECRRAG